MKTDTLKDSGLTLGNSEAFWKFTVLNYPVSLSEATLIFR